MPLWLDQLCDGATTYWIGATVRDYAGLLFVIIVCGWILSRQPAR